VERQLLANVGILAFERTSGTLGQEAWVVNLATILSKGTLASRVEVFACFSPGIHVAWVDVAYQLGWEF